LSCAKTPGSDWEAKGGPVTISPDGGVSKLALFEFPEVYELSDEKKSHNYYRVAFRMSGENFIILLTKLEELKIVGPENNQVHKEDLIDYGILYSIYCKDPWGHLLEFACYDYHKVKEFLVTQPQTNLPK